MPPRRTTPSGYEHGRILRHRLTDAEKILWERIRRGQLRGLRFRRQHAIGPYVVDFCAPANRLVIELDGNPHRGQEQTDAARSAFLEGQGFRVLRFWNGLVEDDVERVLREIVACADALSNAGSK